jgi:WD40 repeat protein
MAHDVFISYSTRDKTVADAVCAGLEGRKIRCWIAPRDVPPGQTWASAIAQAIEQSRVLVLVFSDGANQSPQVLREVERAVHGGIPILPFRIQPVEPTHDMGYFLGAIHWLDALTPPLERHLQKLGDRVQALLGLEAKGDEPQPALVAAHAARRAWPRGATAGLIAVAVLVVLGALWWALSGSGGRIPATPERLSPLAAASIPVAHASVPAEATAMPAGMAPSSATAAQPLDPTAAAPTAGPPATTASAVAPPGAVQLTLVKLLEERGGRQVLWSPEGSLMVVGSSTLVYDAGTWNEQASMEAAAPVALSSDGTRLACAAYEGVEVWDVAAMSPLLRLAGSQNSGSLAFTADGTRLATGTGSAVKLWDVVTGEELYSLPGTWSGVVAFSADGRTLAATGAPPGPEVLLWDMTSGAEVGGIDTHSRGSATFTFSPDGVTLALGGVDGKIRLWDLGLGRQVRVLSGHSREVAGLSFSPDGRWLASASPDLTVRLWDVQAGAELATVTGHPREVTGVAFAPGGELLASVSWDDVRVWKVGTGGTLPAPDLPSAPALEVAPVPLSPDAINPDNAGRVVQRRVVDSDAAEDIAWSPDGRHFAVGTYHLPIYDTATFGPVYSIDSVQWIRSVAFSPDGSVLAATSSSVVVWDTAGWGEITTLAGSNNSTSVAFSPDGRLLATGTGSTVKLWDAATGQELQTLPAGGAVFRVVFSSDGSQLVTADTYSVKVWNMATRTLDQELEGTDGVEAMAFSPDGRLLAIAQVNAETVRLVDSTTWRQARVLFGHKGQIASLAFSPGGRVLAAGSGPEIKLWNVDTGEALATLRGHASDVRSLAFSPDGSVLLSSARDGTLRVWAVAP